MNLFSRTADAAPITTGTTMVQVRNQLNSLDTSELLAWRDGIALELAEVESAMERAGLELEHKRQQLAASLDAPDPHQVARAYMKNAELGPKTADLKEEIETLVVALRGMRIRQNDLYREQRTSNWKYSGPLVEAVRPMHEELEERACAVMREIAELFACASTLDRFVTGGSGGRLANNLQDVLAAANLRDFGLKRTLAVPNELQSFNDTEAARAYRRVIPSEIPYPSERRE